MGCGEGWEHNLQHLVPAIGIVRLRGRRRNSIELGGSIGGMVLWSLGVP